MEYLKLKSAAAIDTSSETGTIQHLLTLCSIVFLGFLTLGISLGTLPSFITNKLHYSSLMVGIVIGIQSAATLASRHFSGTICDTRGSKKSVCSGLIFCALTGVFYLLSNATVSQPSISLVLLLIGRLVLGFGESLLITGALSWGIGLMGVKYSGKVMAWNGISMYGALAFGAPIGMWMENSLSLNQAFIAILILPAIALALAVTLKGVMPAGSARMPFYKVIKSIWRQGSGLALATVGFGVIASFITLYFAQQQWQNASLSLTIFGIAYILARLFFSHLPDKHGGHIIAFYSLLVEVAGLTCIRMATSSQMAFAGVALTGFGFSLVFPSLGVEAVKQVAPQNRGVALGAYVAFFDLALGITGPLAGLLAGYCGYAFIYLAAAVAAAIAILLNQAHRTKK
ncbi:MFS transporter [Chitinophaga sp. HK235]|uniref:MFS transporter n=1 Tax=Chitinophaga sp. HK235 TaxID=2952571 RepID=UPI001BA8CB67|nr:MFS transporter [Chitinophaga sp. HK235]